MSNVLLNSLRGANHHEIIGCSKTLPTNILPSLGNVLLLRHIFALREAERTSREPTMKNVIEVLPTAVEDIKSIWIKASIPQIISDKSIFNKLKRSFDKYKEFLKAVQSKRNLKLCDKFQASINQLFAICLCRCSNHERAELRGKLLCNCPESNRIYIKEVEFLADQRAARKMLMSAFRDKGTTYKYRQSVKRKARASELACAGTSSIKSLPILNEQESPKIILSKSLANDNGSDRIEINLKDQVYQFAGKYSKKNNILTVSSSMVASADRKLVSIRTQTQQINGTLDIMNDTDKSSMCKVSLTTVWRVR